MVAHGVQALPAAEIVAGRCGARLFCDVIEIPSFEDRVLESQWHPTNIRFLDLAFEKYLMECDGLLTVGPSLGKAIEHFGAPVRVVQNYRYAETLQPSNRLRERCGLSPDERLVLSISTTANGFEDVLGALASLPETVHLATLGRFVPHSYEQTILRLIEEMELGSR